MQAAHLTRSKHDKDNISRFMAAVLRHGRNGIRCDEVPKWRIPKFLNDFGNVSVEEIRQIVDDNSKKRFEINTIGGELVIRATQGHSLIKCK